MKTVCRTPRLTLRHLCHDDAEFIVTLLNEPSFIENIADKGVRTIADAINYLDNGSLASYQTHGFGFYLVELNETRQAIGICGFIKRPELKMPDLGYAYLLEFGRKGYAKEAAQAVLDDAKTRHNLTEIAAVTNIENIGSIRLLEGLGFVQLKTMVLYQDQPECRYFELNLIHFDQYHQVVL